MERFDSLKPGNEVTVIIEGPEGETLYKSTNTGFHNIDTAIKEALTNANLNINPEDCVFVVKNDTSEVSHRYRINAHGNLKLIV